MALLNSKTAFICGSLLLLTACGSADKVADLQDKAAQVQDLADKAGKAKDLLANAGPLKDKVLGMKTSVSQTLTAVKSGDFATAQSSFGQLQTSWQEIEGDIKNLSADGHAKIQSGMDTVKADLNAENPNGEKVAEDLKGLNNSLGNLAGLPSSDSMASNDKAAAPVGGGELSEGVKDTVTSNLAAMKGSLAETTSAVESADFATAKTTFADARQSWFKFGGSVKQSAADTYQSIDDGVKTVNTALNSGEPSQENLLTDLGGLSESLDEVAP